MIATFGLTFRKK